MTPRLVSLKKCCVQGPLFMHTMASVQHSLASVAFLKNEDGKNDPKDRERLKKSLTNLRTDLEGVPVSGSLRAQVDRLIRRVEDDDHNISVLIALGFDVQANLLAELKEHTYLIIPRDDVVLLQEGATWFTGPVGAAFPDAVPALEDCAHCLAFGKGTAAVFHAMCAVEFRPPLDRRRATGSVQSAYRVQAVERGD